LAAIRLSWLVRGGTLRKSDYATVLPSRSVSEYIVFSGNGTVSAGWPALSDWVSDLSTM
jgi:hypothetical protein